MSEERRLRVDAVELMSSVLRPFEVALNLPYKILFITDSMELWGVYAEVLAELGAGKPVRFPPIVFSAALYPDIRAMVLLSVTDPTSFIDRLLTARFIFTICDELFMCDLERYRRAMMKLQRRLKTDITPEMKRVASFTRKVADAVSKRRPRLYSIMNMFVVNMVEYAKALWSEPDVLTTIFMDFPSITMYKAAQYIAPFFGNIWSRIRYKVMLWIQKKVQKLYEPYL